MDFTVNIFFEIINIVFALVLLVLFKKYFQIEDLPFLILLAHFLLVFLTNYVLFPPSYMSDQFAYLKYTMLFREGGEPLHQIQPTVYLASKIYAYLPFPLINSIFSIAIINFILFSLMYVFLKKTNVFTKYSEYFFLLYPSLALYSSLALRDTMVLVIMVLFLYFLFVKKWWLLAALTSLPLIWLKNQNLMLLLIVLFLYMLVHYKDYNKVIVVGTILASLGLFILFQRMFTIQNVNNLRFYFYFTENPDRFREYRALHSWAELLTLSVSSFFSILFEPLPWKSENGFQLIQSIENISILGVFIALLRRKITHAFNKDKLLMIVYFIVSMMVYGLIIINYGTAARYRFPFIITFFVFYSFCGKRAADPKPAPRLGKVRLAKT